MKLRFTLTLILLTTMLLSISHVFAAVITFSNKALFLSSTSATSSSGLLPNIGTVPGNQVTVGSVTISAIAPNTPLFMGAAGISQITSGDWYNLLPGHDIALSGFENLNIDFANPVYSAGFDFAEPDTTMPLPYGNGNNPFGINSTFTVTLKSGITVVATFQYNAPDDTLSFVGVWSDTAFDRMEIRETSGGIDDEYFGEFYAGTTPLSASAIPTLSQWGLIILALTFLCLGGIALFQRNRKLVIGANS